MKLPDKWYDEPMQWADEAGLIRDGRPDDGVTRAEVAIVLMRFDERMDAKIAEAVKRLQPEDDKAFSGLLDG